MSSIELEMAALRQELAHRNRQLLDSDYAIQRLHAERAELLAALKSCFAMLISPKFSGWIDANCADDELWAMAEAMILRRDEARAALARVEGRQPCEKD